MYGPCGWYRKLFKAYPPELRRDVFAGAWCGSTAIAAGQPIGVEVDMSRARTFAKFVGMAVGLVADDLEFRPSGV